jgi:flagellar basal-body rod modification protein FlgD
MAVQSVASTPAAIPPAAVPASTGTADALGQADFLLLLTKQMQNQDPLSPLSGTDFVTQLAQFSSLQGVQQLNTSITQMLTLQQVTQGANLIGKQVAFASGGNVQAGSGKVTAIQISGGTVQMVVGNQTVPLSQLTSVGSS